MDCVNHSGVNATAFCQNCGKALCVHCVRNMAGGQIFCEPCGMSWQGFKPPFVSPPSHGPNPSVAAVLGLIPGVGAMYNGQFVKGMIHVVVFAVLVGLADHYGLFGLLIAFWVIYQAFEAYHTAKAMRDGAPLPDPFGINEIGNLFTPGSVNRPRYPGQTVPAPGAGGSYQPPAAGAQYHAPYSWTPYTPPAAGFTDPANQAVPPVPPPLPIYWRRKEPVGAIILIALGVLFLLGQLDIFSDRLFEFTWPVALIGLGIWLMIRRLGDSQGGHK
jgi:hypothetical protein